MEVFGEFSDSFIPIMDGVGMVTRNYAFWLNKKYGRAYVVTVSFPGYKDSKNEPFEILRCPSFTIPKMSPYRMAIPNMKFKKIISSVPFNIIHSHSPFFTGGIALKIAREKNIPIIATFHSKYRDDFERFLPFKWLRTIAMQKLINYYNAVDHVWVPNKATINTLREYGFRGNIEVMYNGTDLTVPNNQEEYIHKGQEIMNVTDNDFVLLYIGQHRWEKNLKLMIEALRIVMNKGKQFKLILVGQGYAEKDIKQMVINYKMNKVVSMLGVIRDRDLIKALYSRANLFLFPSLYDTSPLTIREAAAFNKPTIFIKDASAAEGIEDGKNGFLTENNPENYAAKLIYIMEHPKLIKKIGRGAKEFLYRTWEQVSDKVYERYIEIIDEYNSKHR
ncbi:MAG: glycosyltransferase family 4 protein [Spirochaetes bacterium]|nr:MAG: glycosyltransferase family 4 protein [Spirochaetota bacterium]